MADSKVSGLTELLASNLLAGDWIIVFDASTGETKKLSAEQVVGFFTGSWAAGDIIYHDGTQFVRLAKGAADQYLRMNSGATAPTWAAGSVGSVEEFTSSGTWTKPAGADANSTVIVEAWGGGGAGSNSSAEGGGGGGAYARREFKMSDLGSTETVTVGSGGVSQGDGGDTSFGSHLTAYGGQGTSITDGGGGGGELDNGSGITGGSVGGGDGGDQSAGSPLNLGQPASTIYGGGGGGSNGTVGGDSVHGGAGGGGGSSGAGGSSAYGGDGGNGGGNSGSVPGGGGGADGGSGGAGMVIVRIV